MNKDLLDQQMKALRWSKESGEIVYNAANVIQFCIQQLLVDDAAVFFSYMEKQPEMQQLFGDIQEMMGRFLETNLEWCGESLKNRIVPKLEQAKAGTQTYLNIIRERSKKREEIVQREKALQAVERDVVQLQKELGLRNEQIQDLKNLQKELAGYHIQNLEEDVKELEKKVEHEKELYSLEEEKEKRLKEQVQSLKDSVASDRTQIEKQCVQMKQESTDLLNKKKESEIKKKERLQKLEQREREYIECWEEMAGINIGAKKHLTENEKVAEQMASVQIVSDAWMAQRNRIRNGLSRKLAEIEDAYNFMKQHMDFIRKETAGKEKV